MPHVAIDTRITGPLELELNQFKRIFTQLFRGHGM